MMQTHKTSLMEHDNKPCRCAKAVLSAEGADSKDDTTLWSMPELQFTNDCRYMQCQSPRKQNRAQEPDAMGFEASEQ